MKRMLSYVVLLVAGLMNAQASANEMQILLVRSEATQQYFATGKGDYNKILDTWRAYFTRSNTPFKEITFAQLRQQNFGE